jgi:DNA-binding transcriptional regulator PaaX
MLMASNTTKEMLLTLLKAGGVITIAVLAPGASPLLKHFVDNKKLDKRSFNRTLKRLEGSKLITVKSKDGQITVALEIIGKQHALEYELDSMVIATPKKWDQKWRIVVFDIPDKKKTARKALKTKLDQWGFIQFQESVYIYPYPCEKEVRYLCSVYGLSNYIKFILAEQIDGQDNLQHIYKLVPK